MMKFLKPFRTKYLYMTGNLNNQLTVKTIKPDNLEFQPSPIPIPLLPNSIKLRKSRPVAVPNPVGQ